MNIKAGRNSTSISQLLLAENLRALLKNKNLNISQVAQALGLPMMTIRRLISGETTDPRISTLKLVADHFNISIDSLIEGNNKSILSSVQKTRPHFVPILDWGKTKNIKSINELELNTWKEWQPLTVNEQDIIGKNAFALESLPAMHPRFPQDTVFIIDPDVTPTDGDIILVKINNKNELTLQELTIEPLQWQLHSLVSGTPVMQYSTDFHQIIGVNMLTILYNRRERTN